MMGAIINFILGETKMDSGDTAWILTSSALVMLMTFPGLALFYGGLTKSKNVLNTIMMSISAYAITSVLWVMLTFSLSFGDDVFGIIGNLKYFALSGVLPQHLTGTIPTYLFAVYQLTFAAITVALVSGSLVERMKFSAWVVFVVLWGIFVYAPVAHWVWGGGFLAKLGALDFAGGTVVHINAGMAGLAGALVLGKRKKMELKPGNMTLVVIGTGLLWFGWFGFNAGSAVSAGPLASSAFLVTNTATATAALSWTLVEKILRGKPTILGFCSGAVAGLVAITPASGYVNVIGSIVIGFLAGIIPFLVITYIKPLFGYDDALDVFGVHGVAGFLGAVLTGVFADPNINEVGKGLIYGNPKQFIIQIIAALTTVVYSFIISFIIMKLIPARVDEEAEEIGLDESLHGEKGYDI